MSQSWKIDPKIGDYVMDGGAPAETDSLQVPAYFRLKIKRKQWLYAPDDQYGSDYYTLQKRPAANGTELVENVGANALEPLIDDGRATDITVKANGVTRNGVSTTATIVDASGQEEKITFPGIGV